MVDEVTDVDMAVVVVAAAEIVDVELLAVVEVVLVVATSEVTGVSVARADLQRAKRMKPYIYLKICVI